MNPKQLYFYNEDDERCYPINYILQQMIDDNIQEKEVYKAVILRNVDYFFCKEFNEVSEKGICGKGCISYTPRNGKSGCCKYARNVFTLGDSVTININQITIKQ